MFLFFHVKHMHILNSYNGDWHMEMLYLQRSKMWRIFFFLKNYLPLGFVYLNVFKEKKPKDQYCNPYNLQLHALQFQNL